MKICILNGYIVALSESSGMDVSEEKFEKVKSALSQRPKSDEGCQAMLRVDTCQWEQVKMPPIEDEHPDGEEATAEDYENALADLGVRL